MHRSLTLVTVVMSISIGMSYAKIGNWEGRFCLNSSHEKVSAGTRTHAHLLCSTVTMIKFSTTSNFKKDMLGTHAANLAAVIEASNSCGYSNEKAALYAIMLRHRKIHDASKKIFHRLRITCIELMYERFI